ncbi:MAG TPA: phosphate ABC transporter substrate-binding protein [Thermoanaerobaculia bacterium]|jgi:ABC-type phosphate transport system substrate-binding protein|nr:phosphate ABC transporter substrate-binding protein [Thermoanaerobaculia bacterium]
MRSQAVLGRPRIRRALLFLLLALGASLAARRAAADSFVVIVNTANSTSAMRTEEVSAFFLKKAEAWPDGTRVSPVDLDERAPSRESFSNQILAKSTAAVKAYWQKMIFSGRAVPPPEKASPEEVVSFVKKYPGGIGYVPAGTPLGSGVKVLVVKP